MDIGARIYMTLYSLKEENKIYSEKKVDKNVVYLFNSDKEYDSYFINNGVTDIRKKLRNMCKIYVTKKGTIIASKYLCDKVIKNYEQNLEITQAEEDEIHSRGKITAAEKVQEWESMDLCAPGDAIGSAADRCKKFKNNCHDCLLDYASKQKEYDKIEFLVDDLVKNNDNAGSVKKMSIKKQL